MTTGVDVKDSNEDRNEDQVLAVLKEERGERKATTQTTKEREVFLHHVRV